jgi:NADPH-dependent curcumin reductase CurA
VVRYQAIIVKLCNLVPRNWINILVKRLKVQGFIVFDYQARAKEAFVDMSKWMAEGKLQAQKPHS